MSRPSEPKPPDLDIGRSSYLGILRNNFTSGVNFTSASSGKMGRLHFVCPRLRSFALVEPGASTST